MKDRRRIDRKAGRPNRTWAERFFIEPAYYWLDLYGADGRPSHHKVLSTWGYFFALGGEFWWAKEAVEITMTFVILVAITLALPMGKDVFKEMIRILGGRVGGVNGQQRPSPSPSRNRRTPPPIPPPPPPASTR